MDGYPRQNPAYRPANGGPRATEDLPLKEAARGGTHGFHAGETMVSPASPFFSEEGFMRDSRSPWEDPLGSLAIEDPGGRLK